MIARKDLPQTPASPPAVPAISPIHIEQVTPKRSSGCWPLLPSPAITISEREIAQAPLAQLTWYHHVTLLDKLGKKIERLWYVRRKTLMPRTAKPRASRGRKG